MDYIVLILSIILLGQVIYYERNATSDIHLEQLAQFYLRGNHSDCPLSPDKFQCKAGEAGEKVEQANQAVH